MDVPVFSRRDTLGGAGGLIAALASGAATAAPSVGDPRGSALGQVKMEHCLDGTAAIWSYSGILYAVQPGTRPRAILGVAGGSASWAEPQPDGAWHVRGATMSFFRDPESAAFLDTFENPFTGKRNQVRPNILSGGGMHFPAGGGSATFVGKSRAGESTPGGFNVADPTRPIGRVDWSETPSTIMLMTDHAFEVPVQPQLEARTIFADRTAFFDPRVKRMPARMTTTTIVPWLRWMEMATVPGHLVWHCSGEKLFDAAALPADYRMRAGGLLDSFRAPPAP